MATTSDVAAAERLIPAPPAPIFDRLADPSRHRDIDGSGTLRDAQAGSERLAMGSQFGMAMKMGIPYSMLSEVIEFEENRRIAWQTRPPVAWGAKLGGGRIWRYELEPTDGGTLVRETWDIREERGKQLVRGAAKHTRQSMEQTLDRIAALVTE